MYSFKPTHLSWEQDVIQFQRPYIFKFALIILIVSIMSKQGDLVSIMYWIDLL